MAKLEAMPETTSAPPLPLYSAVVTVSDITQTISQNSTRAPFLRICLNSAPSILGRSVIRTAKAGFVRKYTPMKSTSSNIRAMTVASAAPRTPSRGKPRFP